jgi:DNA-binding transcriptional MocR family regulator
MMKSKNDELSSVTIQRAIDLVSLEDLQGAAVKARRLSDELDDLRTYDHSPQGDWPIRRLIADTYRGYHADMLFTGLPAYAFLNLVCRLLLSDSDVVWAAGPLEPSAQESIDLLRSVDRKVEVMKADLRDVRHFERELLEVRPAIVYLHDPLATLGLSPAGIHELFAALERVGAWVVEDTSHRPLASFQSHPAALSQSATTDRFIHLGGFAEWYHPHLGTGFVMLRDVDLRNKFMKWISINMIFPVIFPQRITYFFTLQAVDVDAF